jgi:hypothetical protein
MAFTHHFLVQWAAYNVRHSIRISADSDFSEFSKTIKLSDVTKGEDTITMFKAYVVLGDDVVIADSAVAESYKRLLLSLDMPVSEAKTHVSTDSYEFAKRWVMFRKEVTPFSIGGLGITIRRYSLLFSFLSNQATHGWVLPDRKEEFEMVFKLIRHDENTRQGRTHSRAFLYKLFYYLQHLRELTKSREKI